MGKKIKQCRTEEEQSELQKDSEGGQTVGKKKPEVKSELRFIPNTSVEKNIRLLQLFGLNPV